MTLGDLLLKVGVTGLSEFQAKMGTVGDQFNKALRDADKAFSGFDKLGDRLTSIGTGITVGVTVPLVATAGAAVKFASDFEAGMRKVASVIGGDVTAEQLKRLSDQTLELSRSMGIDAVDAARALQLAIGTGIPENNALDFLRVASEAAIGGITDTSIVVDSLTTVLAAYGLEAADAGEVTDKMFEALRFGKGEFADLASTIGPAAAMAKNMGISLDELLVSVGTLSVTSGGMSQAVTQVEAAMKGLNQTTPEMEKALKAIGFETGTAAVSALGFTGALEALAKETGGSTAAFTELFGRQEAVGAALGLTGIKAATVSENMASMANATDGVGARMIAFNLVNTSTERQFEALVNTAKATAIEFGTSLLPAVNSLLQSARPFIEWLASAVEWFTKLPQPVQNTVIGFVAIAAAVGPVIAGAGQLISLLASIGSSASAAAGILTRFAGGLSEINVGLNLLGGGGGALALAGVALASFGAAAYATYSQLDSLKKKHEEFSNELRANKIRELLDTGNTVDQIKALGFSLDEIRAALSKNTVEQQKYATSIEGLNIELVKTPKVISNAAAASDAAKKSAEAHAKAVEAQKKEHEALTKALSDAKSALSEAERLYKSGKVSIEGLGVATANVEKAQSALDAQFLRLNPNIAKASSESINFQRNLGNLIPTINSLNPQVSTLNAEVELGIEIMKDLSDSWKLGAADAALLGSAIGNITLPAYTAADAMRELGIRSSESLRQSADASKAAYDTIKADTNSTAGEIEQAWRKMTEAQRDYARSIGDSATADALDAQLNAHRQHGQKVTDTWSNTIRQVSTAFTDFSKGIVNDLFEGDFSITKSLSDLGQAFSRIFVEQGVSYINTFVERGVRYLMRELGGLLDFIPGIGSALSGVFGGAASGAGAAGGAATGGGGGAGAGSGAVSGLSGWVTAISSGVSAITDVLSMFGVGVQGTIKDRISEIKNDTAYLAWVFDGGGTHAAIADLRNNSNNYMDALSGWVHAAWVEILGNVDSIKGDVGGIKWIADQVRLDVNSLVRAAESITPAIDSVRMAVETMRPSISVTIQGNVVGNEQFASEVATTIERRLAAQGI